MEPPNAAPRPPRRISRRRLLGAGASAVAAGVLGTGLAVQQEWLPGRSRLYHLIGHDGPDGDVPDLAPGPAAQGSFRSVARGTEVGWAISRPPGSRAGARLPVAIVLHGRGADHASAFSASYLGLDRFLAAAVGDGVAPFALASVDGGDAYWHDRADGDRCQTMVLEEFVPLLARQGLDTDRIALLGWSMGGYGALHLAGVLGAARVPGVAALSPALWHTFAACAPGAFDDADDFARSTVLGRQPELDGVAVRIDCGDGDPFHDTVRDYVAGFATPPTGGFELGDHDLGYWRRMAPAALHHVGDALARR